MTLSTMRAVTVQQPWASAIFAGKDVENRTTNLHYRGPLLIHAGQRGSQRGYASPHVKALNLPEDLPQGAILGVVQLVDVHPSTGCCRPWGEDTYHRDGKTTRVHHLVLEDPRLLPTPVVADGRLGLWRPDTDLLQEILEGLAT